MEYNQRTLQLAAPCRVPRRWVIAVTMTQWPLYVRVRNHDINTSNAGRADRRSVFVDTLSGLLSIGAVSVPSPRRSSALQGADAG
jgi:hypothetical protein